MKKKINHINNEIANNHIVGCVLELLRSAVLDRSPLIPNNIQIDWNVVKSISVRHGILAWIWDGICRLPETQRPDRFQRISWALSAQEITDRYNQQKSVLVDLVSLFKENRVRLLLLKGIGLSYLYPNPQYRPSGDIDIFLFDDFEKGNVLLGIDKKEIEWLHTSCDYKGVHIENHKIFIYPNTKIKRRFDQYLRNETCEAVLMSDGYYTFPCIPNYIYLMFHMFNHVIFNSNIELLNIRNILDLAMYLDRNQSQMPPQEMKERIRDFHLEKPFDLILYLSEWLLDFDFETYHFGIIKDKDLRCIHDFMVEDGFMVSISSGLSWKRQFIQAWNWYIKAKCIYKYMPQRNESFLLKMMHQMCSILVRGIFRIPQNQTIRNWLRG